MSFESLFDSIHEEALPGIWSKGVAMAREKTVVVDCEKPDECVFRVKSPGKAVAARVSLWPAEDDAHCDCGERITPCAHIVAAIVARKNGWAVSVEASSRTALGARLVYRFSNRGGELAFERLIVRASGEEQALSGASSLVSLMGGIGSGRVSAPQLAVTREDYRADQIISGLEGDRLLGRGVLDQKAVTPLLGALKEVSNIELDGLKITVDSHPLKKRATLEDTRTGVRLLLEEPTNSVPATEYRNGLMLVAGVLRPVQPVSNLLREAAGREFGEKDLGEVALRLIPLLEKETDLHVNSIKLPHLERLPPRVVLELNTDPARPEELGVMARLVYGNPPIAEVIEGRLELLSRKSVPLRDEAREKELVRDLRLELHLVPRSYLRLIGKQAIEFLEKAKTWEHSAREGSARIEQAFAVRGELAPRLLASGEGLDVRFGLANGDRAVGGQAAEFNAHPSRVLAAWREGQNVVPLVGGGWARLPAQWLEKHAEALEQFLDASAARKSAKLSVLEKVQLAEFCVEAGGELAPELGQLRSRLTEYQGIPELPLPADLTANLRPYQKLGVNWLGFLRDSGLGAILADDMGLGKTLQALCAVRGRTLIVAPTSVLPSWEGQLREFRPALKRNIYYGPARKLSRTADVHLTSYGILRQDRGLLTVEEWDTIILDETQAIKNPDSQLAKIAHELRGKFKIALTGTPIENRLSDLWSQLQFVQPGLLGTREQFEREFGLGRLGELRRKLKPLILRRMKRDVAPELPPKTETTLYSVLSDAEQTHYQTILAATQSSVIRDLEAGGSIMGALEALLRLRQVCAHPALVPGLVQGEFTPSSKLELLRETLEESLELGHSVLIFSQWTSLLDLVERVLGSMKVDFLRLDGATTNRSEIIGKFQDPTGPRVMVLSLKAGGVGITLTKADHVIILDPWWNPAVEDQAADRAHRIGQTQPVLVQRLVARDTVEDRILELQKKKQELARAVLGQGGEAAASIALTREDLLELLR